MTLHPPFTIITSRLLPGLELGDVTLSLFDSNELSASQERAAYFIIDSVAGWTQADSVGGGAAKFKGPVSAFSTYLSFLLAAVESLEHRQRNGWPESSTMFPRHVTEWASYNKSEIETAHIDMCDEAGVPNEDLIEMP